MVMMVSNAPRPEQPKLDARRTAHESARSTGVKALRARSGRAAHDDVAAVRLSPAARTGFRAAATVAAADSPSSRLKKFHAFTGKHRPMLFCLL